MCQIDPNVTPSAVNFDNDNLERANPDAVDIDMGFVDINHLAGLPRPPQVFALCLSKSLRWETGAVIPVTILNTHQHSTIPSSMVNEVVKRAAKNWEVHANITFPFVQDPESAVIRIEYATSPDPSSVAGLSFIGTTATTQTEGEPTMTLTIGCDANERDIHSVALHEFGHALGMMHEHASPASPIKWDVPAVIACCGDTASTRDNYLRRENSSDTEFSPFDPKSIMIYNIPCFFMRDQVETDRGSTLSTTDKEWARIFYPFKESSRPKSSHGQRLRRTFAAIRGNTLSALSIKTLVPTYSKRHEDSPL